MAGRIIYIIEELQYLIGSLKGNMKSLLSSQNATIITLSHYFRGAFKTYCVPTTAKHKLIKEIKKNTPARASDDKIYIVIIN